MFSCMKYTVPQEMCQGSLPSNFSLDSQPSMGSGCTTPRMFHISSRTDLYWVAQPLTQVFSFLASLEGVEPSLAVLETAVLPLGRPMFAVGLLRVSARLLQNVI